MAENHFSTRKLGRKRGKAKTIIRDAEKKAQQNVAIVHRERRNYLRGVLKEALLILEDEPGLIAPQALLVFELLSYSRHGFPDRRGFQTVC